MGKKKTAIKVLEFDKFLGNPTLFGRIGAEGNEDELDTVLRDAARMKIRKAKMLELDKYLLETKMEMDKLKEGADSNPYLGEKGEKAVDSTALAWAKELTKLPETERRAVVSTYAMIKSSEKGGAGAAMMPLLLNYAKANPGATQGDMLAFAKVMGDQFQAGAKLARDGTPPDPYKPLEIVMGLIRDSVQKPLQEMAEKAQPRPSALEQIILDDRYFVKLKELGLFGGQGGAGTSSVDLEIEKLRGERMMESKRLDLEARKMMLEHEAGERRTDAVFNALTPLSAIFASPVEKKMRQLGRSTAAQTPATVKAPPAPIQSQAPVNVPPASGDFIQIRCTCGHRETVSFEGEPPKRLNCPACGLELVTQSPEEPTPQQELAHREGSPEAEVSPENSETDPTWAGKINPRYYYTGPP